MRLSTTLRLTPVPSTKGILSSVVMLYVYVVASRSPLVIAGQVIDPVALAVAVRILLQLAENSANWPRFLSIFRRFSGPVLATFALPLIGIGLLLWANSAQVAQVFWSAQIFLVGVSGLILVRYGTPSMKYIPSGFPKTHATAAPIHAFLSASLILQALIAAALFRYACDLAWIAYVSAGSVAQIWLTNWLAMLWLIAHEAEDG